MELKESSEELRRIGERIKQAGETILPLLRSFEVRGQSFFYHNVVPNGTLESLGQLSATILPFLTELKNKQQRTATSQRRQYGRMEKKVTPNDSPRGAAVW
jgi:hypothetical protein